MIPEHLEAIKTCTDYFVLGRNEERTFYIYVNNGNAHELLDAMTDMVIDVFDGRKTTIIDNGDVATASTGEWKVSSGENPYGTNSVFARGANATYSFLHAGEGTFDISLWWTYYNNRLTSIKVEIYDVQPALVAKELIDTVYINQQENAAQWNSIGKYTFRGLAEIKIIHDQGMTGSTCADAVRFIGK